MNENREEAKQIYKELVKTLKPETLKELESIIKNDIIRNRLFVDAINEQD